MAQTGGIVTFVGADVSAFATLVGADVGAIVTNVGADVGAFVGAPRWRTRGRIRHIRWR